MKRTCSNMKWPWLNGDFVDGIIDSSLSRGPLFKFLTEGSLQNTTGYYPKWNVNVDPMCKADAIRQTSLNIKNEYLTGKKENKNMRHTDTDDIFGRYINNKNTKNAKNDRVKNILDKWISSNAVKAMIPKMIKHNGPATIVFWVDGTKTVVKANPDLIEEKRICYLGESGKRHYKTVTIDRTDDSAAVMYAFIKKWVCNNNDRKFHRFLKVVESREEK